MFKTGILVLLWVLLASGELQQETETRRLPPPGKLDFGYVPAGVYETVAHYEPGPIGILFHMVQAFLYVVQPNAFPQGKRPHIGGTGYIKSGKRTKASWESSCSWEWSLWKHWLYRFMVIVI